MRAERCRSSPLLPPPLCLATQAALPPTHAPLTPPLLALSATPLERALKRLEWDRVRAKEMQDAADEAEKERMATQAIDW